MKCLVCDSELTTGDTGMICHPCKQKDYTNVPLLSVGWKCPNCGAGLSPYTDQCPNCRPVPQITCNTDKT